MIKDKGKRPKNNDATYMRKGHLIGVEEGNNKWIGNVTFPWYKLL